MKKYIMAIDQGTTSSRVILFDQSSNMVAIAQKEVETLYPHPGWVEQSAEDIWSSVVAVIFEALAKANLTLEQIAAIGITNQRETTVIWDKKTGKPVYQALVWQSRQTAKLCEEKIEAGLQSTIQNKTGLRIDPYFSASKIRWILDTIEDGQERAERGELLFGTIDSWLVYRLTGKQVHVTDVSNASRTLLMDLKKLQWDEELCTIWNIPKGILPEIKNTAEVYGTTDSAIFGKSVPIASIVGDQQAALFGQTCFKQGDVKNTYGTGCFMLMNIGDKIIQSKHGLLTTVAWRINNQVTYALEGSVFVAGAAVQWLRDGIKLIQTSAESEDLATSIVDSDGVVVVPSFVGLGTPYWQQNVKGAMFGLTRGTTEKQIVRATLESLAYQSYDVLKAMEQDTGLSITTLQVDGGASTNNFLMQWQANVLQTSIHRPCINETTALGAAYLAGLAVGYWKDYKEIQQNWQEDQSFQPNKSKEEMKPYLDNWKKAIEATCKFQ